MLVAPSFVVHCAGHQMQHLFVIYCDYTQDLGEYVQAEAMPTLAICCLVLDEWLEY